MTKVAAVGVVPGGADIEAVAPRGDVGDGDGAIGSGGDGVDKFGYRLVLDGDCCAADLFQQLVEQGELDAADGGGGHGYLDVVAVGDMVVAVDDQPVIVDPLGN